MLNFGRVLKNPPPSKLFIATSQLVTKFQETLSENLENRIYCDSCQYFPDICFLYIQYMKIYPCPAPVDQPSLHISAWAQHFRNQIFILGPTVKTYTKIGVFHHHSLRNVHGMFIGSHSSLPGNFHQQTAVPFRAWYMAIPTALLRCSMETGRVIPKKKCLTIAFTH